MKIFTKLIRLIMTLMLMSVIVLLQAQSGKMNTKLIPVKGSDVDFAIPGNNPFESQAEQKGISGTDDMTVMVLDHNGYISSGRRAPSNGSNYQRAIYLLTPTNMTSSGITTGTILNSIGWQVYGAGNTTLTGTLNIYLLNTSDATFTLGTSWSGAIGSFAQVCTNASYTVPIVAGWFDVPFTSNFTYTGGGIYVAWEFSAAGTPGTTIVTHYVNTTLTGGIINNYSNTAMPDVLTSGASRPMTRLGLSGINDIVGVTSIYTLEKAPIPYGAPVVLGAGLQNITASDVVTDVTIEVRKVSDNSLLFTNTQLNKTITAASYTKIIFTSWTPTVAQDVKYIVFTTAIPGDTWTFNNTKTILGTVNNNLYSYFYTPTIATNYGFGTGTGIFSAKYTMSGSGLVTGANIVIGNYSTNTGGTIQAVMLNSAGVIVATAPAYVLLAGDLGTSKSFTFTAPAAVTNDFFYIGLLQVASATAWYPMGCANEVPQRGTTFYTFAATGGTPTEFTLNYKYLLEAQVTQAYANDMAVDAITSPATGSVGVQNVTITVLNAGTATQSNIPVYYTYNAINYNGTVLGPLAQGASVSYTFPQTINPPLGANTITACTNLAGDENASNDCKTLNFNIFPVFTCEWTISLYDSYGDGWNGGQMDVVVDGYTLLDNITLASGLGPVTYAFGTNTGSAIQTLFVVNGSYPEECYYEVYNNFGALIATSGPTGVAGVPPPNLNLTGNCDCSVTCPPGAIAEGEPQIPNEGMGTNDGCAMAPATPIFQPINFGETFCGQTNTYTLAGVDRRDNDYYRIDLSSPACNYWNLNFTVTTEFNSSIVIFQDNTQTCNISVMGSAAGIPCVPSNINVNVPSGIYYLVVRAATAAGNPYPYGSGPWEYVATLANTPTPLGYVTLSPTPPATITKTVPPGGSTTEILTIGNTGTYPLTYSAFTTGAYNFVWGDQFDTYVSGVQLAVQNPTNWTTWSNAPGSTEDPVVSNAQAYTGSNSVLITGVNDCVHTFPNYTTGSYKISHRMYIVSGNVGYFNTLLTFAGAASEWGMQVAFETNGTATIDAGIFAAATFPFAFDTWNLNEVYVDLDNDYAEYWFNGTFIWSWQWSVGTGGYTTNQLAANNFYAYTGAGSTDNPLFYIDDYKLEVAGNDWLTLDGGLGANGTIPGGGTPVNINIAVNSTGKPIGTYTKNITLITNEVCGGSPYDILVTMYVGYSVSGNVYYGLLNTKPQVTTTSVILTPGSTIPAGAGGAYDFRPLASGTYDLIGSSGKAWGGLNSPDPTLAQRYILGLQVLTNLQKRAADVNLSGTIQSVDVTMMKRRILGQSYTSWVKPTEMVWDGPFIPGWHGVSPTWIQTGLSVGISGSNVVQDVRCLFTGDVNNSFTPLPNP